MSFPDITAELKARMPELRGRLLANQALKDLTWFRVGGPDAVKYRRDNFPDGLYSVQLVTQEVEDLGYFSHAVP